MHGARLTAGRAAAIAGAGLAGSRQAIGGCLFAPELLCAALHVTVCHAGRMRAAACDASGRRAPSPGSSSMKQAPHLRHITAAHKPGHCHLVREQAHLGRLLQAARVAGLGGCGGRALPRRRAARRAPCISNQRPSLTNAGLMFQLLHGSDNAPVPHPGYMITRMASSVLPTARDRSPLLTVANSGVSLQEKAP